MPCRQLNTIDARLLRAERAAARELRRIQRTRKRMDRFAANLKRSTTMPEKKFTVIEPDTGNNAVAIGFLLGGLALVALLMALFAPLDSTSNASTLKLPSAHYFAPR